ncbi:hypothetical protein ACP8HI_12275 [Paenibacillus sp. FA6]|uniref:hypothetical protein n=1 Tax=Paenibacillus sp. FA6 TaxID=3413029 RepID=UPI003F658317
MSLSSKKTQRGKKLQISSKRKSAKGSAPNLSTQQIAVIAALLAGFFDIQSVIYSRDNVLQVILTTARLTELPILGEQETDIQSSIDIDVINNAGKFVL